MLSTLIIAVIGAVIFTRFPIFGMILIAVGLSMLASKGDGPAAAIATAAVVILVIWIGYLMVAAVFVLIFSRVLMFFGVREKTAEEIMSWILVLPVGIVILMFFVAFLGFI